MTVISTLVHLNFKWWKTYSTWCKRKYYLDEEIQNSKQSNLHGRNKMKITKNKAKHIFRMKCCISLITHSIALCLWKLNGRIIIALLPLVKHWVNLNMHILILTHVFIISSHSPFSNYTSFQFCILWNFENTIFTTT